MKQSPILALMAVALVSLPAMFAQTPKDKVRLGIRAQKRSCATQERHPSDYP